jgi:uncharacterized protein
MTIFRRVIRWVFFIAGFIIGIATTIAFVLSRRMITPPRQQLWATPDELGLLYETVQFPAQDGLRLSGWFVPAPADSRRKKATAVLVHGWAWNRLGDTAEDVTSNLIGNTPVDMLRLLYHLHQEGFHVLTFDLRNHGESAAAPPITFGLDEANDLLGALTYLKGRTEVDPERIGVVGFSMGANALLYTLAQSDQIGAAVAVQPTSGPVYAPRMGTDLFGPLGQLIIPLAELFYRLEGGPSFNAIWPKTAVSRAYPIPVLYIQGQGDRWGSVADVTEMAAATVNAHGPLLVESNHRCGGYQYAVDNPKIIAAFFEEHLPE